VAAVGFAGLKFASSGMRALVQAMAGAILLMFLVKSVIDRGERQAFAIGFIICALTYSLVTNWELRYPTYALYTGGVWHAAGSP
jgi:hypothetical protein